MRSLIAVVVFLYSVCSFALVPPRTFLGDILENSRSVYSKGNATNYIWAEITTLGSFIERRATGDNAARINWLDAAKAKKSGLLDDLFRSCVLFEKGIGNNHMSHDMAAAEADRITGKIVEISNNVPLDIFVILKENLIHSDKLSAPCALGLVLGRGYSAKTLVMQSFGFDR